jgi:hypothetical protein
MGDFPAGMTLRDWLAFNIPCDDYVKQVDFSSHAVVCPIDPDDPCPVEPDGYTAWRVERENAKSFVIANETDADKAFRAYECEWNAWYIREQVRKSIALRYRAADMALKIREKR